jgi:hypothetical protein
MTLVPGGKRDYDGIFKFKGTQGGYYSSTEGNVTDGIAYIFFSDKMSFGVAVGLKIMGFSVRCIKD